MAMNTRIFQMPFADVYPLYLQKASMRKRYCITPYRL